MRKRAQRKSKLIIDEPKHIVQKTRIEKKHIGVKKNWWVAVSLIFIFLLVLFLNSYFNITSEISVNPEGEGFGKFYLSGPDPYYNMRLVNVTLETGRYPFYSGNDPLLNYPLGASGGRPPLLNMFAIGFSRVLTPFMDEIDAVGYSMQFIPALFGALLVFPVYFIGKTLFDKRAGLVAAFLIALIPIHIGSGHGSAYSLFDHDSLNLLLFFLAFLFFIKGIKDKDRMRSVLYALLAGVSLGALSMTWVEARFLYAIIAVYAIVQMLIDIFTDKIDVGVVRTSLVALLSGYLISLPVIITRPGGFRPDIPLFLCIGVAIFGAAYYVFGRRRIPWTISLPVVFSAVGIGLVFLYFIREISSVFPFFSRLTMLRTILYGSGIYGAKVSLTIAEAGTYSISRTVMSFGPALYWLGWIGFLFLAYRYYKDKQRKDYLFIVVLFLVDMWLIGIAGRFLNDFVPVIAILGGWMVWMVVDKIDYKQMIRNIRSAGGGFHGLRRGVKILHISGILFIALLVILPNAYLAFDAAVPSTKKGDIFGKDLPRGAFGLGHGKETYWIEAYTWLSEQDTEIEDPADRPAYISWWDYGFYEVAVGGHPTVADNFQDGIWAAGNFITAQDEKEAVIVWIVRLIEGHMKENNGEISPEMRAIFDRHLEHLGENVSLNLTNILEDPSNAPSAGKAIGGFTVTPYNARCHDSIDILSALSDEELTWLYHDIQHATERSIRYYGTESYDLMIFEIFTFLSDKADQDRYATSALIAFNDAERSWDFVNMSQLEESPDTMILCMPSFLISNYFNSYPKFYAGLYLIDGAQRGELPFEFYTLEEASSRDIEPGYMPLQITHYEEKFYNSMFYKVFFGGIYDPWGILDKRINPQDTLLVQYSNMRLPCYGMKHFVAEYLPGGMLSNNMPVVIARYYEGAFINGSVNCNDIPLDYVRVGLYDKVGIPHDNAFTDEDGNFSLIAPAGNITLQFSYANEILLEEITFNDTDTASMFSPVTDAEAMRVSENYTRLVHITVDPPTIEGFVYEDNNNSGSYELDIDTPLPNVEVQLNDEFFPTRPSQSVVTDENGYYNFSNLIPSKYTISALEDGFEIHSETINIGPGDYSYNISKPKSAAIEGKIFYDKNNNVIVDLGEEMNNVKVDLIYSRDNRLVNTMLTDETGAYSFSGLVPGDYIIDATKTNITTGYLDYEMQESVTPIENKTLTVNISIYFTPVTVSGYTKYLSENIDNISINFEPNKHVVNNTAESAWPKSNEDGFYEVELMPGSYNVSVEETVNVSGQDVTYTFTGSLEVAVGEGIKSFDIILMREES